MTMEPDHAGWTHEQELAWHAQVHAQELARTEANRELALLQEKNRFALANLEAGGDRERRGRRQAVRFLITIFVVALWLAQTGFITYHAVYDAAVLIDSEKYILLIGVTGAVVYMLIPKLWPDAENDATPANGKG